MYIIQSAQTVGVMTITDAGGEKGALRDFCFCVSVIYESYFHLNDMSGF